MKKIVVLMLLLMLVCSLLICGGMVVQADKNYAVNADKSLEIVFIAESAGSVVIKSTKDDDKIQVKAIGDKKYEVWYTADEVAENKPDKYLEVDTNLVGEHKINIKNDNGIYVVFVDGVMSAPYLGEDYALIDLSDVTVTVTGGVSIESVTEGVALDNEINGVMTTAVNGEMAITPNNDGTTSIVSTDHRFADGSAGDPFGNIGARNRVVMTKAFDVREPIVFYAKSPLDSYVFGLGKSKYDLNIMGSTDATQLGIQAFRIGDICYITDRVRGATKTCAYRQGASNTLDKFVIEVGEESTKITINDASFWGVYEDVYWKQSDFPDGKVYLMFSFFSNGTTQGATQELNIYSENWEIINSECNVDDGIEIDVNAQGSSAVKIENGNNQIIAKLLSDSLYKIEYVIDGHVYEPDAYFEVPQALKGRHKISIKKDRDEGVYIVFIDGVMSAPYIGQNCKNLDFSNAQIAFTGAITVNEVKTGEFPENEVNGLMTTAVNEEMKLFRNQDNSMNIVSVDHRFTDGSAGDPFGNIGARNRVVMTKAFDVREPIVFYAKSPLDSYVFGLGKSKYDLNIMGSTDATQLGIQAFRIGDICYITDRVRGATKTCAYRQGASNTLDKFVIEVGEESTKITINDASFWGVYEDVYWKQSDFAENDYKVYLMFSFFSNGTTQGATQELNVSLTEPMSFEDSIKNYYMGEDTDIVWQFKQLQIDKVELKYNGLVLDKKEYSYDANKQELTIRSDCLKNIFQGSDYSLKEIQVCDVSDGFVYADLKIMLKRPVDLPEDNGFQNSDINIKDSGFFSESGNIFFVIAVCVSAVLIIVSLFVLYKKFWRKSK